MYFSDKCAIYEILIGKNVSTKSVITTKSDLCPGQGQFSAFSAYPIMPSALLCLSESVSRRSCAECHKTETAVCALLQKNGLDRTE